MKVQRSRPTALWLAALGAALALHGCGREEAKQQEIAAAANAAAAKAKEETEKAAAAKYAAEKAAAEKAAAEKAAAEQAAAKVAAEKAAAEKAAAEKAAAAKAAAERDAATPLPADLLAFKAEVGRAVAQIDMTVARLDVLAAAAGDLEKPSEEAAAAIAALDTESQAIKKRSDGMRERGAAYFEAWEKQLAEMSTPGVVAVATARKDELAAKYAELLTAMQESRAAYDPLWADLQAIGKAIEDGMTPEKLKEVAPQIKAAKEKAATVKGRIEAVTSKLQQVAVIYTKP